MRRVVITGLGAITPIGKNIATFWGNLIKGKSGSERISRFNPKIFKTRFACEVKDYDASDYFERKEARKLNRFSQFGMIAGSQAITDANIDFSKMNLNRVGVIFASGIGGFETLETETISQHANGFNPRFNPFFITKIIANGVAGMLSIKYGLKGINSCPVSACASSTQAVIHAFNYIKWGKADMIIAGGAEAPITPSAIGGFNAMKAMSTNNENCESASKPFDKERDGFVIGEGAGALVIESLESAQKRDAKIYAEIVGGGETADAFHITGTHPDGEGAYFAMKTALEEGNISPEDVDYINAHATSTGLGDISETKAIDKLFTKNRNTLNISATKSMTGHLLGAVGAVEAIATCLSIKHDEIPPTINTKEIDESIPKDLNFTLGKSVKKKVNFAISNSFGFGGHCTSIAMKKYMA
ncbi:MAG: beta-ketoacyl-ACP synthase II [Flavobacteriales bacterium]